MVDIVAMNAVEIIKEIQKLPDQEKAVVYEFINEDYVVKTPNAETLSAIKEPLQEGRSFANAAELFAELDKEC